MKLIKNLFNKNRLSSLKKKYFTPRIIGILIISLFLLVQCSPVLSLLWLSLSTLYLLYISSYKDIFKIWGFTLGIWYLIFTTSLSEITIVIGFENTEVVINYLLANNFRFKNLCYQTVYLFDALSIKLGFSISIPTVVNIFSWIAKFIKNKKIEFQEIDFYKLIDIITFTILILSLVVTLCLHFFVLYKNFSSTILFKSIEKISITLKKEIKGLKFSYKSLLFGLVFFMTFLLLMMFNYIKPAFLFLFFVTLYMIKDFPSIKSLNNEVTLDDLTINEQYKQNYKFIYYFNKFIKIVFCVYVLYFFSWCLVGKSYVWMEQLINWENPQIMEELSQAGQNLYLLYCLFLNSLMLDYCIQSSIMYTIHSEQVAVVRLVINVGKRTMRVVGFAIGGGTAVAGATVYSPLVEIPGVNEFQVRFGRGYGYKTSIDYVRGNIYQSYFSEEQMFTFIQKYSNEDKILDGIFFRLLSEDKEALQILRKNATVNELRFLGLKYF